MRASLAALTARREVLLFTATMLQQLVARLSQRFTPGVYRGPLAALIPIDIGLSLLAKRSYQGYRVWDRYWTMTNPWFDRRPTFPDDDPLLSQLHQRGFAAEPHAYPADEVDEARRFVLELYARVRPRIEVPLRTNEILRWTSDDILHEFHSRTGNVRFYLEPRHAPRLPSLVRRFLDDPKIHALASAYFGGEHVRARSPYMMAEVLLPAPHPETWHIDCIRPTLKSFLYLDEVTLEQGPLRVIPGTHQKSDELHEIFYRVCRGGNAAAYFEQPDDAKLDPRGQALPAPSGTLTLFDTRMLHAGSRCVSGSRIVLVNGYRPLVSSRLNPRLFRDPVPTKPPWLRH